MFVFIALVVNLTKNEAWLFYSLCFMAHFCILTLSEQTYRLLLYNALAYAILGK